MVNIIDIEHSLFIHIANYIYIYRERERGREVDYSSFRPECYMCILTLHTLQLQLLLYCFFLT